MMYYIQDRFPPPILRDAASGQEPPAGQSGSLPELLLARQVRDYPRMAAYRHQRAGALYQLGRVLDPKTRAKDQEDAFREALAIYQAAGANDKLVVKN